MTGCHNLRGLQRDTLSTMALQALPLAKTIQRLQLGGLDKVLLHNSIVRSDGQEVGQLGAGGELVEELDGLPEVPPGPARLAQLPVRVP